MSLPTPPAYMQAFEDSDWDYYVAGHDPDELRQIDDLEELQWGALFMRPMRASQAPDYGYPVDEREATVTRNKKTGRFEPVWFWIECSVEHRDAQPFLGCKYKPS